MADRRMVYPYTLTAKLASFPFKFYYTHSPYFKCSCWAVFVCMPFFLKLQNLSCSEVNYIKLAEYKRKELEEIEKHKEHLI